MTKIVVLDAGHGGHDPGAQSGGLREKDLTLDIVKRTINKLKKYNVKVIATRTTDKFISLSGRANIANKNKADLFVSVHINSGGGTGFESFIYNGSIQSSTKSFQNTLHKAIMNKISVNDRGKKSANFAVVRETNMPAVLTENLFVDGDNKLLSKSSILDNIAQGHADGIAEFLGLKKSSNTKPPKPTQSSKPSTKPNNELGLVDWMKANKMDSSFNNRKKLAAQYGIKGYKGTASQNNKLLSKLKAGKPKPSKPSKPKPKQRKPKPSTKYNVAVDGSWGPDLTRNLQRYFGTTVDGVVSGQPKNRSTQNIPSAKYGTSGSNLIRAMQRHYKCKIVDGKISGTSNLIKAMQRKYGLKIVDGHVSLPSNLVKEIQRRLNNGTL